MRKIRGRVMLVRGGLIYGVLLAVCTGGWAEPEVSQSDTSSFYGSYAAQPRFTSSDPLLSQVWTRSTERLERLHAEQFDSLLNDPPEPYWGGPAPWYESVLRLNSGHSFLRDALLMVQHPSPLSSQQHDTLATYFLEWPGMLKAYWMHTGDRALTEALAEAYLKPWLEYFRGHETNEGLLPGTMLASPLPDYLHSGWDTSLSQGPDAVLNAFYYHGIQEAATLLDELGYDAGFWHDRAQAFRSAYRKIYLDPENNLFRDGVGSESFSVVANALSLRFGLAEPDEIDGILELIRTDAGECPAAWMPYLIEACFQSGAWQLGYDLITFLEDGSHHAAPHALISGELFGLNPLSPEWKDISFAPRLPGHLEKARTEVDVPLGRISVRYDRKMGYVITAPLGTRVLLDMREGDRAVVRTTQSHTRSELTSEQWTFLDSQKWTENVGDAMGIWIDIDTQMMRIIQGSEVLYQARCASAEKGVGSIMNSLQTPLGWHSVVKKIGDGAPWGQVFRARIPTREVWQTGEDTKEDLVLTRVMLLTGEEPGLNKGGNVDSFARHIYIHGTNDESRIGTPSSHGCIRLTNDDVIETFSMIPKGIKVLLTASEGE